MTTIPGFIPLTPLREITYQGLQIAGTAQGVEIGEAIGAAFAAGNITYGSPELTQLPDGSAGWRIKVTINGVDFFAYQGDWIVLDSEDKLSLWHGSSPWPGTQNKQVAGAYTANTPLLWGATSVAPSVTALDGMQAKLSFDKPSSANAPFTYTVSAADLTASTTAAAALSGDPVEVDGVITLTVVDLVESHQYSFTATVHTQYDGVTADSLVTEPITALPSPPA